MRLGRNVLFQRVGWVLWMLVDRGVGKLAPVALGHDREAKIPVAEKVQTTWAVAGRRSVSDIMVDYKDQASRLRKPE